MKKIYFLVFLMIFFLAAVAGAGNQPLKFKILVEGTTSLRAREKSSGRPLWQSNLLIKRTTLLGRPAVLVRETGSGIYGSAHENLNWIFESYYFVENDLLIPGRAVLSFKDQQGRPVRDLEKNYDQKGVSCSVNGKKQGFSYRPGLLGNEFLGPYLANYPFDEKNDFVFFLLTHEPMVYKMTVKYRGMEQVSNGHISVNCHKLEMIPDLGALGLLGAFVPKTYFWFEVEAPHRFFRYEGLESGLGTPYIVEEVADQTRLIDGR